MENVLISVEEMAQILCDSISDSDVFADEFCKICKEVNGHCIVDDSDFVENCPHEKISEYRLFVRTHFRKNIVR